VAAEVPSLVTKMRVVATAPEEATDLSKMDKPDTQEALTETTDKKTNMPRRTRTPSTSHTARKDVEPLVLHQADRVKCRRKLRGSGCPERKPEMASSSAAGKMSQLAKIGHSSLGKLKMASSFAKLG